MHFRGKKSPFFTLEKHKKRIRFTHKNDNFVGFQKSKWRLQHCIIHCVMFLAEMQLCCRFSNFTNFTGLIFCAKMRQHSNMRELITYIIEQKCDICTVDFHYHITVVRIANSLSKKQYAQNLKKDFSCFELKKLASKQ